MRFKDFEIVIHGDFESGDDELDLRSAIAKKLGGLGSTPKDQEAETVEKIENGEARWAPPLQQHLDVLKQSLTNNESSHQTGDQITKYQSSHAPNGQLLEAVQTEITLCSRCGNLIISNTLKESLHIDKLNKIAEAWQRLKSHYGAPKNNCTFCE
jgi:hypothetical protein